MKLIIIVGTRPELIRLSCTIKLANELFDMKLVHTGQNYDYNLNDVFFNDLDIPKPDYYLNCSNDNFGNCIGDIITKTYSLLINEKPNAILILGDTNSCLSSYVAKRLKIPIFHLEAGNRSFDPNVPEEINRKIIDHISDVNMCYMEHARLNLLKENFKSEYTFVVGSPILEVYNSIKSKINKSTILSKLNLNKNEYFVWSSHREDNIDNHKNFEEMVNSIQKLSIKYNKKIVFGAHPRCKKKIISNNIKLNENIIITEPFGIIDYYHLLQNSLCVISDSGTISEEANILNIRAILLRFSTEHPETIDAGSITMGNIKWDQLEKAIEVTLKLDKKHNDIINYKDFNFSEKVCRIITGYYEIVNKFLWLKN